MRLLGKDRPIFRKTALVGSRTIPGAVHKDSDYDILCLVWSKSRTIARLEEQGCVCNSNTNWSYHTLGKPLKFVALRNTEFNYIVTSSSRFYNKFLEANQMAKHLQLIDKSKRVDLFQYILYGDTPK